MGGEQNRRAGPATSAITACTATNAKRQWLAVTTRWISRLILRQPPLRPANHCQFVHARGVTSGALPETNDRLGETRPPITDF
jgi:hypothetical protein